MNLSVKENCIKEVKEEAGLDIEVEKLIALHDLSKHCKPLYPYGLLEVFFLCKPLDGQFEENGETIASKYFAMDDLPNMSDDKGSKEQALMCFKAYINPDWQTEFE